MSTSKPPRPESPSPGNEARLHTALFYRSDQEYVDGILCFIEPALAVGEPVAAALPPDGAEVLRRRLNGSADRIKILDMVELGRNPARIIPEVEGMLAGCGGMRLRYVGEPVWPGCSDAEIHEAIKHEALINLAWPSAPISVLCPYNTVALAPAVLADAERTHPYVIRGGTAMRSETYDGPAVPRSCDAPLDDPPSVARSVTLSADRLSRVRAVVAEVARAAGLSSERIEDLRLVATELGTNAIRHGRGTGVLHIWGQPDEVTCQVHDRGQIADPLAGRRRPGPGTVGGVGLWMVNQLCDLVEARTGEEGTTVRVHMGLTPGGPRPS